MLGAPELEGALQVGSHRSMAEGQIPPLPFCPHCGDANFMLGSLHLTPHIPEKAPGDGYVLVLVLCPHPGTSLSAKGSGQCLG